MNHHFKIVINNKNKSIMENQLVQIYQPYTFEDADEMIGGFLVSKSTSDEIAVVVAVTKTGVFIGNKYFTFSDAMKQWKYTSGDPFGKVIE